ncbi:MAG: thioredoxin domain-containing protein [Actinomycetota bacterium]|nr:thioredoxin domain-containing protein [Actinomycetota bacterium]
MTTVGGKKPHKPSGEPREAKGTMPASARAQRSAATEKAAQLRAEADSRARRSKFLALGGLALAVVALVVAVVVVLGSEEKPLGYQGEPGSITLADVSAPSGADADGGIAVGPDLVAGTSTPGAVVVEVLYDYRCPYCAVFDEANGPDLKRLAHEGKITLVYRPVSFLDRAEGSKQYSTRSATAAAIVADRSPEHFVAFHEALMTNQPDQGEGPDDEAIAEVARVAGVPEDVVAQLDETAEGSERTFARWVFAATERGGELLGKLTTPSVLIDGERFPGVDDDPESLYKTGPLREAIEGRL